MPMRRWVIALALCLLPVVAWAQCSPTNPTACGGTTLNTLTLGSQINLGSWTTSGRPLNPATGATGFNTTTSLTETWNGSAWVASGGGVAGPGSTTSGYIPTWGNTSGTSLGAGIPTTGTGNAVLSTSPSLTTPALGTPSQAVLTNATGLPNSGLINNTISGVGLGSNLNPLTFGSHLSAGGSSYNGTTNITITSDATNANTASTIVSRDASGNFSAGTITAGLTGHASLDCALGGCTYTGTITGPDSGTWSSTGINVLGSGGIQTAGGTVVVSVMSGGAKCNGSTDDASAINTYLATFTKGAVVYVPAGVQCLINSANLTIPPNVSLQGVGSPYPGNSSLGGYVPVPQVSAIILNPAYSIVLDQGASLQHLAVYRSGLITTPTAAQALAAVTAWGADSPPSQAVVLPRNLGGQFLFDDYIVGFTTCFRALAGQFSLLHVAGDCYNGADISYAGDDHYLNDVRFEPYYSIGLSQTNGNYVRPGIAFYLHDGNTGGHLTNVFAEEYAGSVVFNNIGITQVSDSDFEFLAGAAGSNDIAGTEGFRWVANNGANSVTQIFFSGFGTAISDEGAGTSYTIQSLTLASATENAGIVLSGQPTTPPPVETLTGTVAVGSSASVTFTPTTGASFTGVLTNVATNNLAVSAVTDTIAIGQFVTGTDIANSTQITAGSGSTWTVNTPQAVSSEAMVSAPIVGQPITVSYVANSWDLPGISLYNMAIGLCGAILHNQALVQAQISCAATTSAGIVTLYYPKSMTVTVTQSATGGVSIAQTTGSALGNWGGGIVADLNAASDNTHPMITIGANDFSWRLEGLFTGDNILPVNWLTVGTPTRVSVGGVHWSATSSAQLSSCGGSPSISTGATDGDGTITEGTTATGCVLTFINPWWTTPECTLSSPNGASSTSFSATTTALTIANLSSSGSKFKYHCVPAGSN
jgi:hypothetical protein